MIFFKLDYVIEKEQAARRDAARCAAYASRASRTESGALAGRLLGLAKRLAVAYLTQQSWKAHDGVFAPAPLASEHASGGVPAERPQSRRRELRKLAGVKLSESEARSLWPRLLEHKWYLGERLGRDVGLRVAVVDYFENIEEPRAPAATRSAWEPLPRLPMMMPFGGRA